MMLACATLNLRRVGGEGEEKERQIGDVEKQGKNVDRCHPWSSQVAVLVGTQTGSLWAGWLGRSLCAVPAVRRGVAPSPAGCFPPRVAEGRAEDLLRTWSSPVFSSRDSRRPSVASCRAGPLPRRPALPVRCHGSCRQPSHLSVDHVLVFWKLRDCSVSPHGPVPSCVSATARALTIFKNDFYASNCTYLWVQRDDLVLVFNA